LLWPFNERATAATAATAACGAAGSAVFAVILCRVVLSLVASIDGLLVGFLVLRVNADGERREAVRRCLVDVRSPRLGN